MMTTTSNNLAQVNNNNIIINRNASEPLNEGDLIELECVAHNSKPAANISWFNGMEQIATMGNNELAEPAPTSLQTGVGESSSSQRARSLMRFKRLIQRKQIQLNSDGQTYTSRSFLSLRLTRHDHKAQISCQASNEPLITSAGSSNINRVPLVKTVELNVQRKCCFSSPAFVCQLRDMCLVSSCLLCFAITN